MHVPKMLQRLPFLTKQHIGKTVIFCDGTITIDNVIHTVDNVMDKHNKSFKSTAAWVSKITSVDEMVDGQVTLENGIAFANPAKYKNKVCKVTGALYGLAHSAKTFHDHLHK